MNKPKVAELTSSVVTRPFPATQSGRQNSRAGDLAGRKTLIIDYHSLILGVEIHLTFVKHMLQTMVKSIHLSLHPHTASQFYHCFKEGSVFPVRLGCPNSEANHRGRVKIGFL